MASAQVLSNSSRKEHLEAGKRRLEEFRKKKAADRAKKAASASQPHAADSTVYEIQALNNVQTHLPHSGDAGTSGGVGDVATGPSGLVTDNAEGLYGFSHGNELKPTTYVNADPFSMNNYSAFLCSLPQTQVKDQENKRDDAGSVKRANPYDWQQAEIGGDVGHIGGGRYIDGILSDDFEADYKHISRDYNKSYNNHSYLGAEGAQSNENNGFPEVSIFLDSHPHDLSENVHHERTGSILFPNKFDSVQPDSHLRAPESEPSIHRNMDIHLSDHVISGVVERKLNYSDPLPKSLSEPVQASEKLSSAFHSDVRDSSSHSSPQLAATETHPRRSRPSFLDSLNIPRASSGSGVSRSEQHNYDSLEVPSMEVGATPGYQKSFPETVTLQPSSRWEAPNRSGSFPGNAFGGQNIYENNIERKFELHSQKQNEDFAALEQHIEDLTQERFSLQRALDASKALAESLAAENSSLTESYNQQASVVNQLKLEMEKLQVEINAQLGELESMRLHYTNAHLECSAADERAKLLASEVISLEEKALRLRSSELKLEKELERSNDKLTSCKKKLSSLEKDRRDLQLTIDALQEEKKLLQSKLRKASARGTSDDINKGYPKKDVSTSTDDLGVDSMPSTSNLEGHDTTVPYSSDPNIYPENRPSGFEVSSMMIPPDHMQMIENINTLISELTAEKEQLTQALITEISESSKLKDLNKELSKKLEVQTQRLELLAAQNMANKLMPTIQPTDSRIIQDNVAYADEGDEVVERVLGWILKLFPGGPSKRRSSKLL